MQIVGRAATWHVWRFDTERPRRFDRGCFDLDPAGVELWINHQRDPNIWGIRGPIASTVAGSLEIQQRPSGLYILATIDDAFDRYASSFRGLSPAAESWYAPSGICHRAVLHEVSVIVYPRRPAFTDTFVKVASPAVWRLIEALDNEHRRELAAG